MWNKYVAFSISPRPPLLSGRLTCALYSVFGNQLDWLWGCYSDRKSGIMNVEVLGCRRLIITHDLCAVCWEHCVTDSEPARDLTVWQAAAVAVEACCDNRKFIDLDSGWRISNQYSPVIAYHLPAHRDWLNIIMPPPRGHNAVIGVRRPSVWCRVHRL